MRPTRLILPLVVAALVGCSGKPDATPSPDAATREATADAAAPASGLALADATVQLPAVPGRPAVAYFVLTVGPDAKGKLVSVNVTHFARAELHESKMERGAMTMSPVDALPLTPGKPIVFAPGGLHVMLFDAAGTLKAGDNTDLTVTLDNGTKVSAKAKVTAPGGGDAAGMKM